MNCQQTLNKDLMETANIMIKLFIDFRHKHTHSSSASMYLNMRDFLSTLLTFS